MRSFGIRVGIARLFVNALLLYSFSMMASGSLRAEDVKLRQTAMQMLERANAASTTPTRPKFEHIINFRVYASDANQAGQGQLKMIWAGPTERRNDTSFGDFHLVNIWYGDELFISGKKGEPTPAIIRRAMKFLPLHLVRFDHEDIIRSIEDGVVRGRAGRCIEFDTSFGNTVNNNEICVDKELGTMLRFRDGEETEEYSEYFQFSGAYLPGRTDIFRNGAQIIELHQTYAPLLEPVDPGIFAPPAGAEVRKKCQQTRQAFGVSMPQPKSGVGDQVTDVVLQGVIGPDGKVYLPVIMTSDRPDLNQEALNILSRWSYTPALCDGKPNWDKGEFILHFQGR